MCENNLSVGNFDFEQEVNYTYFKNNVTSYIDHAFIPNYAVEYLQKCSIVPLEADNISDHLPLSIWMDIKPRKSQKFDDECFSDRKVFPRAIWSDPNFQIMYGTEVKNALSNVCFSDVQNLSMDGVKKYINKLCDDLCSLLHRCVSKCLEVIPQKRKHN